MILHDAYALHRKWWRHDWTPGVGDTDWTTWDYVLADVFQVIEDYTDPNSGQWMPYDQSADVFWDVGSSFSGAQAAIDRERERRKGELKPGESLYATPTFRDEKNKPTLASWFAELEEGKAGLPVNAKGARPPTAEELAAMGS
jgi:hypothetical protein